MDILHKFKQNGYFTADLYHLLAKKRISDPSEEVNNVILILKIDNKRIEIYLQ